MAHAQGAHGAAPAFDVVLRGYDRRQVDDHLGALEGRLSATTGQCNELRLQRDAAASRVQELEQRLNGTAGVNALPSAAPPGRPATGSDAASLDGLGAKVEAILRVATEEAAGIRRSAEDSVQLHAQAEVTLRGTFQSIAERLAPLVQRLEQESSAAQAALPDATTRASTLETTAEQQAKTLTEAAAANAERLRAEAQERAERTARQVADVREELALVKQILTSLDGSSKGASPPPATTQNQPQSQGQQGGPPQPNAAANSTAQAPLTSAGASGPRRPAGPNTPLSPEAPTETIALPLGEPSRGDSARNPGQRAAQPPQPPT